MINRVFMALRRQLTYHSMLTLLRRLDRRLLADLGLNSDADIRRMSRYAAGVCGPVSLAELASAHDLQADRGMARIAEAKLAGRLARHVDDAPANERPAIVDAQGQFASIALVDDLDDGAERQGAVGRSHGVGVHHLARGCGVADGVPGGTSTFGIRLGGLGGEQCGAGGKA